MVAILNFQIFAKMQKHKFASISLSPPSHFLSGGGSPPLFKITQINTDGLLHIFTDFSSVNI